MQVNNSLNIRMKYILNHTNLHNFEHTIKVFSKELPQQRKEINPGGSNEI